MQQQNNWSIGRACLPIEKFEAADLHRSVMGREADAERSGRGRRRCVSAVAARLRPRAVCPVKAPTSAAAAANDEGETGK